MRSYTLAGGRVALHVTADSAELVTAMPDSGFSVQTWSGTDWLRVDFSSGAAGVIADRQLVRARADRHRHRLDDLPSDPPG